MGTWVYSKLEIGMMKQVPKNLEDGQQTGRISRETRDRVLPPSLQKEPTLPTLWSRTSVCDTIYVCCLTHPLSGILFHQAQQINVFVFIYKLEIPLLGFIDVYINSSSNSYQSPNWTKCQWNEQINKGMSQWMIPRWRYPD